MTTPAPIYAFNGDADGLCALQQLRLAEALPPGASGTSDASGASEPVLVTGVKRHIRLVEDIPVPAGGLAGVVVTVLDVAFGPNRAAVERLLAAGAHVRYFDHHMPGEVPRHPALETHLDTDARLCTSLLVDRYLDGARRAWAVVGAFGDNLGEAARAASVLLGLPAGDLDALRELGELLNYNGYGETLEDLHFHPASLFRALHPYADPLQAAREAPQVAALRAGCAEDLARAEAVPPALDAPEGRVALLPAQPWARRAQGTCANRLANADPQRASAVGLTLRDGTLRLSLRAPLARPRGADALARRFGGGGRAGAAGIDALPPADWERFLAAFREAFRA
jgi:hypothetical protein